MKRFLFVTSIILSLFAVNISFALPSFLYAGFAMNTSGMIVYSTYVDVQIAINDGTSAFSEVHYSVEVNEFGAYSLIVGSGDLLSGNLDDILMKPGTSIKISVDDGSGYVITEGAPLSLVYGRSFAGGRIKGGPSSLQSAYNGGNTINITAVDETTQVERPVEIHNSNMHPNLILENDNGNTNANSLWIQNGNVKLSTYHADGDNTTDDLSDYGFASVIFVDQSIYNLPQGYDGQVLYIVNTLPPYGGEGQNTIWIYYDPQTESSLPINGSKAMHLVSDGNKWYPIYISPFLY